MITAKKYFNKTGVDSLDENILCKNPTGILDFNRSKYSVFQKLYDLQLSNTWFPDEVNTSNEANAYNMLSDNEKAIYKLTFAQLSYNDAMQEEYILDIRSKVNNKVLKAALTIQAGFESMHSKSYSALFDATGASDEIQYLYKTEDILTEKSEAIAESFARHINGNTNSDVLLSSVASINLEGLYFLTGFSYIFTLGDKVPGSETMVAFINVITLP